MTAEQRAEIAKKAARARGSELTATFEVIRYRSFARTEQDRFAFELGQPA